MPLAVLLASVDAHLDPAVGLEAHVVDDGLGAADRERIASALSPRTRLHWHAPVRPEVGALPTWGRMPLTTYQKLTLDRWLPEGTERALWLDCDAVVLDDLVPLWRRATGEAVLLAARDPLVPHVSAALGVRRWRALGLPRRAPYFNAGVLVVELARWRSARVAALAEGYLAARHRDVLLWDQEALNVALAGRWAELEARWNWNPILSPLAGDRPGAPPAIAHFSGRLKPWLYAGLPFGEAWSRELERTAWRGFRPPGGRLRAALVRYARSPGRRLLLPAEQWATRAQHALTRRLSPAAGT